jgi:protein-tyrosine phosphatase
MSQMSRNPRFVPIEGSLNLRDFGGYDTLDGGRVVRGKLFRCGSLSGIEEQAWNDFAQLDIGVICDLRREDEVEQGAAPTVAPFDCRVHIPIAPGSSSQLQASFSEHGHNHEHRITFMKEITREIARDHVDSYTKLFTELVTVENGFLLHCSAGKDRTGFGVAMIQAALGVAEQDIFADYLLTNEATELLQRMMPGFVKKFGDKVDYESLKVIAGVRREYLQAALEEVITLHGSIDGYLDMVGMDRTARQALRRRFVVDR